MDSVLKVKETQQADSFILIMFCDFEEFAFVPSCSKVNCVLAS